MGGIRTLLTAIAIVWSAAELALGFSFRNPQEARDAAASAATRPESRSDRAASSTEGFVVLVLDEKTRQPVPGARVTPVDSGLSPVGPDRIADQERPGAHSTRRDGCGDSCSR